MFFSLDGERKTPSGKQKLVLVCSMRSRERDLPPLLAHTGGLVYNPKSSPAYSCSNNDIFTRWRSFCYGSYFHHSSAAEGWPLGCAHLSLCSLDQTARDLLAVGNPHRP